MKLKSLPQGLQGVCPQLAPNNLNSRLLSPEKEKLRAHKGGGARGASHKQFQARISFPGAPDF